MKKILMLGFLLLVSFGCTVGNNTLQIPNFTDAGSSIFFTDSGPLCNNSNTVRLRTDFRNCGVCNHRCNPSDADRCVDGICRCGSSPSCGRDADCRFGSCVRSDRFNECEMTEDCNLTNSAGNQVCINDSISGRSYCIDVCEFDDMCPVGFGCIEGACTFLSCVPEVCDGIDNDCDGEVDENSDGTGPLSRWCFSGPDITDITPPCRKGVQICDIGGTWSECVGEIPPRPETGLLACNMLDDDCDGCVDGTLRDGECVVSDPSEFDVLYLIDISGSMHFAISTVVAATASFSAIYAANPEFRFALVLISGDGSRDARAFIEADFADFTDFNSVLGRVTANGGGTEPTWDAIYESVTGEIVHGYDATGDGLTDFLDETRTGLSWRAGSTRILILFADERAQTTRSWRGLSPVLEREMCAALVHGESLITFGTTENASHFDDCGAHYDLFSNQETIIERLRNSIIDPCL